ncbi:MAG: alanine racemase [Bosea sp. (in: a-proteobacteria)]
MRQVSSSAFDTPHPDETGATLTVDLGALQANWRLLRDRAGQAECGAVVKANAYGLGIEPAVTALAKAGCRTFFVAHLSEGRRARAVAPDARIYILNGLLPGTCAAYAEARLLPVIGSHEELAEWSAFRSSHNLPKGGALHVDTGMNRLGFSVEAAHALASNGLGQISAAGLDLLMTHFSASEHPEDIANAQQITAFAALAAAFPALPASLKNSSGHFLDGAPSYALTRPGYALYGGNPVPGQPNPMQAVIGLEARIIQLREVPDGTRVGYNGRWTAKGIRKLATINLGYADGYPRPASASDMAAGGAAMVGGVRCPFAGTVSMDLIIVDVTDAPSDALKRGAPVSLIGGGLDLDGVGVAARTIGYEMLTSLGRRYSRRYTGL